MRDAELRPGWLREEMISACRELRKRPWLTEAQRAEIDAALKFARTSAAIRVLLKEPADG